MSHRLYTTEGLILASDHYGEANTLYHILTPEWGLVMVSAQGVRYLKSKLRSQLRNLDHARFTLVRGRQVWRLTGVESSGALTGLLSAPERRLVWARVAKLLRRLMPGEQAQREIFSDLIWGLHFLQKAPENDIDNVELVLVLRLLKFLGYVSDSGLTSPWLSPDLWQNLELNLSPHATEQLLATINHGLMHSQL